MIFIIDGTIVRNTRFNISLRVRLPTDEILVPLLGGTVVIFGGCVCATEGAYDSRCVGEIDDDAIGILFGDWLGGCISRIEGGLFGGAILVAIDDVLYLVVLYGQLKLQYLVVSILKNDSVCYILALGV